MFRPAPPRDLTALPDGFRFRDVEVDVPAVRVTRAGTPEPLTPKAFDLLLLLAANRGRVVEKDEILERVWRDVGVSDNALTRVVTDLRHNLGDEAAEAHCIETVRSRGYRFLLDLADARPALELAAGVGDERSATAPAARTTSDVKMARLTDSLGTVGSPAISPDGKMVAFVAVASERRHIWIRMLAGGAPLQVTHDDADHDEPRWMPDSSTLVYHTPVGGSEQGYLWRIPALGGPPRR
jgi:DNA-binding winged helix-turn-helix (wHTH) protein